MFKYMFLKMLEYNILLLLLLEFLINIFLYSTFYMEVPHMYKYPEIIFVLTFV
jgi:hypothetical protein